MLHFIVPLQGPRSTKNWSLVSRLATRTINSLLQQTNPEFHVTLVCSEPPQSLPSHSSLTILQREFPIPDINDRPGRMQDKWRRVCAGLVSIKDKAPAQVMLMDADDLASNRLAGFVADHPKSNGWIFDSGWVYDEGSSLIFYRRREFDRLCGSSAIYYLEHGDFPLDEEVSRNSCPIFKEGHHSARENMMAAKRPMRALPFPGCVYMANTGENSYGFALKNWTGKRALVEKLVSYRLLTRKLRREYALYPLK